ncbi:NAD(P)H-binding protein [Oceanobacillus jordanicus]|uniref:NAD(P)H-binding protein n=1 Tax=Oceanobacillus jordanicus TaxID=2867266 RepID=A0AAW5B1A1_9BACI|nr:NAD(P)H-binding protein [Oceanobacillus jordanicus]MCG3417540.1 NAD(P)H-binding protein [Oceanobacillus jordanicus]
MSENKPVVAVAGASGYIGQNLLAKLRGRMNIIGLSRNGDKREDTEDITWRSCDLFSLKDAEKGLEGADIAVYLVHSMMPSAKLTQGHFADMDVILADNFAQAAKKQGVKKIIYLGGIVPEGVEKLSAHLKSRLEVERILRAYGTPVTALRAGLIVGPKGSSFPILAKLVKRLPIMILPKWTRTKTQPIALPDVLNSLDTTVSEEKAVNDSYDLGGPEVMTYRQMMEQTAEVMGKKRVMYNVPFFSLYLSRLWLRIITQTPKETVYPLLASLKHPLTANKDADGVSHGTISFKEAAAYSLREGENKRKLFPKPEIGPLKRDVRSVQRIPLPDGYRADEVAKYYVQWLERFLNPWVRTTVDEDLNCQIGWIGNKKPLLELAYAPERSTEDRTLYYISGGFLSDSSRNERGRMEFRKIPESNEAIIAIHDYLPSLPWFVYQYTQAHAHLFIMTCFRHHMKRLGKQQMKEQLT